MHVLCIRLYTCPSRVLPVKRNATASLRMYVNCRFSLQIYAARTKY